MHVPIFEPYELSGIMSYNSDVKGILELIAGVNPSLKWKVESTGLSTNGEEIVEAIIYNHYYQARKGKIVFNSATGKVLKYYYASMPSEKYQSIVDLLLDILNHEREALLVS